MFSYIQFDELCTVCSLTYICEEFYLLPYVSDELCFKGTNFDKLRKYCIWWDYGTSIYYCVSFVSLFLLTRLYRKCLHGLLVLSLCL